MFRPVAGFDRLILKVVQILMHTRTLGATIIR
jgi:hypothetical protein